MIGPDTKFLKTALQTLINSPVPIREVKFVKNDISMQLGAYAVPRRTPCLCHDDFGKCFGI
jgi:hypothetical protein